MITSLISCDPGNDPQSGQSGQNSGSSVSSDETTGPNFEDAYYKIANKESGKMIDGKGYTADDSVLAQWSETNKDSQIWHFVSSGTEGYFVLVNAQTGKAITLTEGTGKVKVVQSELTGEDDQLFKIEESSQEGYYTLIAKNGSMLSNTGKKNDGASLFAEVSAEGDHLLWSLKEELVFDALYAMYISPGDSDKVLAVTGFDYGTEVSLADETDDLKHQWFVIRENNVFRIKNIFASKILNDSDGNITVSGTGDEDNKKWTLIKDSDGLFTIKSDLSDKVLTAAGDKLELADDEGKDSQRFEIYPVDSEYPVPEPKPIDTGDYTLGMMACNLWDVTTRPYAWDNIRPYTERIPFMGFYEEGSPVSVDWEVKALVENGISFVMPCWYREKANEGLGPVDPLYDHWIEALDDSKYGDMIDYAIMFVNNDDKAIYSSFSNEADLLQNLMPYWIETYFKDDNYLKNENKPVLIIYNSGNFIEKLNGVDNAKKTVVKMEQMTIDAGFAGLELWGQFCWGSPDNDHTNLLNMGFDAVTAYHVPTFGTGSVAPKMTFTGKEMIAGHENYWSRQLNSSLITYIPTVSMGLDGTPWGHTADEGMMSRKWRFTPEEFEITSQKAADLSSRRIGGTFADSIIMYDNWNEFGEGHYILPTEQFGFGYLEAIRNVFGE